LAKARRRVDFAGKGKRTHHNISRVLKKAGKESVAGSTLKKYTIQKKVMDRFLRKRGWSVMTAARFEDFLVGMILAGRAGRTAATYRAAWLFHRELNGYDPPRARKMRRINRAIAGMTYKAGAAPSLPRGALDSGMLKQLRFHARVNGMKAEADGFALTWYGMLRHNQLCGLRKWDVRFHARKGPLLALGRKKAFSATRMKVENLDHFKAVPNCRALLKSLCKGKKGRDLLFPNWSKGRARALIREAAAIFDWDTTVKWDGVHTFRHGAAQEWRAVKGDRVSSIMRRATWDSCKTAALYGKPRGRGYRKKRNMRR